MSPWRRRGPAEPDPEPTERLDPRERSWQANRPDEPGQDPGDDRTTELRPPDFDYLLSGATREIGPEVEAPDFGPAGEPAGHDPRPGDDHTRRYDRDLFGHLVGEPGDRPDDAPPGDVAATTWMPAQTPPDPPTQAVPAATWPAHEWEHHAETWPEPQPTAPEPTRPAETGHLDPPADEPAAPEPAIREPTAEVVLWRADEHARAAQRASARADILGKVRAAVGGRPVPEEDVPRRYRRSSGLGRDEVVALFAERVADYKATVRPIMREQLAATIAVCLVERGIRRIAVPVDVPRSWLPQYVDVRIDHGDLTGEDLDEVDGVVTGCALGIAETGTIVLDGGRMQGRRLLSLVPDYHLCVVDTLDVVGNLPEALAKLDPTRPLTFISGPSATSDIELDRVEGVHGPRTLDVLLTG